MFILTDRLSLKIQTFLIRRFSRRQLDKKTGPHIEFIRSPFVNPLDMTSDTNSTGGIKEIRYIKIRIIIKRNKYQYKVTSPPTIGQGEEV